MKRMLAVVCAAAGVAAAAQEFKIDTDRPDALYKCGEPAVFSVTAEKDGEATVFFRKEKQAPLFERKVDFKAGEPIKFDVTLNEPGFVWCTVNNPDNVYRPEFIGAAGFDAEKIVAATESPDDFDSFWADGVAKARAIPLDLKIEKMDDFKNAALDGYRINYANIDGTRIYGFMTVPKKPGRYPVILGVPPAGPGVIAPDLYLFDNTRVIRMIVNIHTYDPRPETVSDEFRKLGEKGTYSYQGAPDREKYYHYRAIIGANRAFEAIEQLPQWDGKHIGLWGSSQGGAYSLILAGLNPGRVDFAVANVPAMCEHTAHLVGRSSGWPLLLENTPEGTVKMAPYFDVVNFAARIECPVMVGVGMIDVACGPSSVYAAYNKIKSPKSIFPSPKMGHSFSPDFMKAIPPEMYKALGI